VSWTIFEGLRDACAERGVKTVPIVSPGQKLDPDAILPRLAETTTDAVAVIFDDHPRVVAAAARLGRPVILLAGQDPSMRIPSVGIGNRYGSRLGTDYLLRKGHRRIALVTWGGRYTIRQREDGFREVMEERGIGRDVQRVIRLTSYEPAVAEAELADAISRGAIDGTTALFCLADNIALGAIRACRAAGLDVPGDISILGFDDTVAGELTHPPLTTIHAPLREIGRAALDELELQVRSVDDERVVRRVELGCRIIERESCRPPQ
jgi:DNA-binding LacI/PurR family transcriptional regulator